MLARKTEWWADLAWGLRARISEFRASRLEREMVRMGDSLERRMGRLGIETGKGLSEGRVVVWWSWRWALEWRNEDDVPDEVGGNRARVQGVPTMAVKKDAMGLEM